MFDAVFDGFAAPALDVRRISFDHSTGVIGGGVQLKYWQSAQFHTPGNEDGFSVEYLLMHEHGRCDAWAKLLIDVAAAQGIAGENGPVLTEVKPKPSTDPQIRFTSMRIKSWRLHVGPHNNLGSIPIYSLDRLTEQTLEQLAGTAAQGNPNPHYSERIFVNHAFVRYAGRIWDPSYGRDFDSLGIKGDILLY